MNESTARDVANFFYQINLWPKKDDLSHFLNKNNRILNKIAQYEYGDWSNAVEITGDVVDALIYLNVRFGQIPASTGIPTVPERIALLHIWEAKWGLLDRRWRVAFIRNAKFRTLRNIDLEVIAELFTQHKKFDSVIHHIHLLQVANSVYGYSLIDAGDVAEMLEVEYWIARRASSWLDTQDSIEEGELSEPAKEIAIDLDHNLDDLDSETIIFGYGDSEPPW